MRRCDILPCAIGALLVFHVRAQPDSAAASANEAAAATSVFFGQPTAADILPTSGTTDPDSLASITSPSVEIASLDLAPQATVEPMVLVDDAQSAAAETPVDVGIVGKPVRFTRRQYAQALAALRRADAAAAANPAGAAAAGLVTAQGVTDILAAHNTNRARHNATALTWDTTVATSAQTWANKCIWGHEGNTGYGENLYWTSSQNIDTATAAATPAWYDEVRFYTNYAAPNMNDFGKWGHFTQVVWRGSTRMGCAAKVCSSMAGSAGSSGINRAGTFVVCRYAPPGNKVGQFPANVLAPGSTPPHPPPPPPPSPVTETMLQQNYYFSSGTATTGRGGCLTSQNGVYKLCIQPDANLVLFNINNVAIWASNTTNKATSRPFGAWLRSTGRLSLFDSRQTNGVYWSNTATTSSTTPHRLVVQNDGNVVIYNGRNLSIWATNTIGR